MTDEIHIVVIRSDSQIKRLLTAYNHRRRAEQAVYEVQRLGRLDNEAEYIDYITRPVDRTVAADWFEEVLEGDTDA